MYQLIDERKICDALYRFAEGIDLRDWELCRSAYTEQLTLDYTSHRPSGSRTVPADEWVARTRRRFETLDATQHTMTNPRVGFPEMRRCAQCMSRPGTAWRLTARQCTARFAVGTSMTSCALVTNGASGGFACRSRGCRAISRSSTARRSSSASCPGAPLDSRSLANSTPPLPHPYRGRAESRP